MAAITTPRTNFNTYPAGPGQLLNPTTANYVGTPVGFPVAASTKIVGTGMVAVNAGGYLVNATADSSLRVIGAAFATVDNTSGSNGTLQCVVVGGTTWYPMLNSASTDACAIANCGQYCYIVDNQTVALTSSNGTRPIAGRIKSVDSSFVWVEFTIPAAVSGATASSPSITSAVRGVVTANVASLAAFTVAGNDGLTYVAGQRLLLALQTTAAQNGPYVVGTVASGTAALTRPSDYAAGATAINGALFQVSEGTVFAGSEWKLTSTAAITIDTTAAAFYPRIAKGTTAAMSGTPGVIATSSLFVATGSVVTYSRAVTGGTPGHVSVTTYTAGAGTGTFTLTSTGNETSTFYYTVQNW